MSNRPFAWARSGVARVAVPCALVLAWLAGNAAAATSGAIATYRGPCDASAAVALDARHFVVGNDENSTLVTYRLGEATRVASTDIATFLGSSRKSEADIEGAARVGDRIYWISSHSRNSRGQEQLTRHRLFATSVVAGAVPGVDPTGAVYRDLLADLVAAPSLSPWKLAQASTLAAEAEGGLNIEGLAATPQGGLLVGFRNPLHEGRALVVPIDNPAEVIRGERARLGTPVALDLGGRGIRSIDLVGDAYWLVAGPVGDTGTFALYRWSGRAADAPVRVAVDLGTLRPEALFAIPGTQSIVLVSDDGGVLVDGRECKDLKASKQSFRTLTLTP